MKGPFFASLCELNKAEKSHKSQIVFRLSQLTFVREHTGGSILLVSTIPCINSINAYFKYQVQVLIINTLVDDTVRSDRCDVIVVLKFDSSHTFEV